MLAYLQIIIVVLGLTISFVSQYLLRDSECTKLSKDFSGRVFLPLSSEYNRSHTSYFTAFENELSPFCIFQPTDAQDLAVFIKALRGSTKFKRTQLAIKSGGYNPWAGSANIEGGVTIDLSKIKQITLSNDSSIASIGTGARWADVYSVLEAMNLTVAGSRVSKVGVGGLVTGGGLSLFSAPTGFVCDNVVNFEVVLASGEIVQASPSKNSDLWLALKGGSNNFGIVTKFDFPTFHQGRMWGGQVYFSAAAVPHIFKAFADFAADPIPDERAHVIAGTSFSMGQESGVSLIYHTTDTQKPPSLAPIANIEHQLYSSLRSDTVLGFTNEISSTSVDGARQWYFTTCIKLDLQLMKDIRQRWLRAVETIKDVPGLMISLVFQPLTKGILEKSAERGGNSFGLSPSDGPLVIALFATVHRNRFDDAKVRDTVLRLIDEVDRLAVEKALGARFRFTNYGYETQKVFEGYGAESLANLRNIGAKYDPDEFFQKVVTTGFKLSQAKLLQ